MAGLLVWPARSAKQFLSTILLILLAIPTSAIAQQPPPQRDASAIRTLQSAIAALGGAPAMASIQDCVLTGTTTPTSGSTKSFTWTIAGSEFRIETNNGRGTNIFLSGHGSPARISNGTASPLNYHMARAQLPLYFPGYILFEELSNSQLTLKYVGPVIVNGLKALQVHISDDSDSMGSLVTTQEWYFDPVSLQPLRVEFREPSNDNAADYIDAAYQFSQFQLVNAISVPSQLTYYEGKVQVAAMTIASVTFNSGVPPDVFDAPQGGQQ